MNKFPIFDVQTTTFLKIKTQKRASHQANLIQTSKSKCKGRLHYVRGLVEHNNV